MLWVYLLKPVVVGSSPSSALSEPMTVSLGTLPPLGIDTAPITLVEFSDFECPFCGQFARDIMPTIESEYVKTGKVQLFFRNYPLRGSHPFALSAAQGATCADGQGRFWAMHDALFRSQSHLGRADLLQIGDSIGLDRPTFASCLQSEIQSGIRRDMEEADRLGIDGTPTFLVGSRTTRDSARIGWKLTGAPSIQEFRRLLKQAGLSSTH